MSCTSVFLSAVFILSFFRLSAQEAFQLLWEPQIALNYDFRPGYSHNFSLSNRNYVYREGDVSLSVRQLDLAHFSELEVRDNQSLALGLQYRFRETFDDSGENEFRLTQQYNIRHQEGTVRLGHRLRAEQRFQPLATTYRFRYRLALDSPLQGEILNVGEAYIIGSLESLLSIARASAPEYDQRFEVSIGWLLQKTIKVETGLEFRLEDYAGGLETPLFLTSNLIISL